MAITVNIYYSGVDGNAGKFAEERIAMKEIESEEYYKQHLRGIEERADEYIRGFKPVIFWRFVPHCIACLYRQ